MQTILNFWWVLESFDKKVGPFTRFFAVETNLNFWRDLEKFSQKSVPSHVFLRCGDNLKILMGLQKISTKMCAQLHVFSLWRLTWVFYGTWKNFHKKVCPVTRFFAVETILSFWWDLESFDKKCDQLHILFAVQTILNFWRDLEKFSQKSVPSHVFLKFSMGLRKISTKICAQLHVFSLWRLTWVFDGTWKNFHKKVSPVTRFFAVETILSFWWELESFGKKM